MAFIAANLCLQGEHGNGFCEYRYDTTDTVATVDGATYINNTTHNVNLRKGDEIKVIQWGTAIRTGTIDDVSLHIVMSVDPLTQNVNLSDDLLVALPTYGD